MDEQQIIAKAKSWWAAHNMGGELVSVVVKKDGYVRFQWKDETESGPYHLPISSLT